MSVHSNSWKFLTQNAILQKKETGKGEQSPGSYENW